MREHSLAPWFAVATVCIGAFMGQLDASIVTIGLPAVRHDLGGSIGTVEWVSLAYLLTLVVLVLPVGRLADSLGRKSLYLYGFAIFTAASLLCGLATGLPELIGARVVQGAGAALLQANSVALIRAAVPGRSLGRAIGVQGAAQAIGLAVGPTVGGFLLAVGSWRLLFLVAVPPGLIGIALGLLLLPRSRHLLPRPAADWPGLALFTPAVVLLLLAMSLAAHGPDLVVPAALVAAGLVVGWLFWRRERHAGAPMLEPELVRVGRIGPALLASLAGSAALFGTLFVVPFFLVAAGRESSTRAGLVLSVLPAMLGIAAPLAGWAGDRFGGATAVAGAGVATLALVGLSVSGGGLVALLVVLGALGLGLGLFTPANNAGIIGAAPRRSAGAVAGLMNLSRGLGTAAGVALAALMYTRASGPAAGLAAAGVALTLLAAVSLVASWLATRSPAAPHD